MEEGKMDTPQQGQKITLESLTKEEIIQKYKGLLSIAKKAKQAKDEILEEKRSLKEELQQHEIQKEADNKALITMKEMLEAYTENKLQLTTQLADLQKRRKLDSESLERVSIENESIKRQVQRLTQDNELLLRDVENMEGQLKQVSSLGKEQKQQIVLLEDNIAQLRANEIKSHEIQSKNLELLRELEELKEKYKFIKDINAEQRQKFNYLKDKFIEVHKKLKKLKDCKRILLETQHEYAEAVSQWQNEIINASKVLCKELNYLREENIKLSRKSNQKPVSENVENNSIYINKLNELLQLSSKAKHEYYRLQEENVKLSKNLDDTTATFSTLSNSACPECSTTEKHDVTLKQDAKYDELLNFPTKNVETLTNQHSKLIELQALATQAVEDYKNQSLQIELLKKKVGQLEKENQCSVTENEKQKCVQNSENDSNYLKEKTCFLEDSNFLKEECFEDSLNKSQNKYENRLNKLASVEQENVTDKQRLGHLSLKFAKIAEENLVLKDKVHHLENAANETATTLNLKEELFVSKKMLEEYREMYRQKEVEHGELLDEMRALNQALKARGDLISRQQEEQKVLKADFKANSEKLATFQQEIDKKENQLTEKQNELEAIRKEIGISKQKLESLENANLLNEEKIRVLSIELYNTKSTTAGTSTDFDSQSDILSTSTISRADELQRFKDVEDSFEDKYNKLRSLAAKLKKKLQEETVLKQKLEQEVLDLKKQEKEFNAQTLQLKNNMFDTDSLTQQLHEKQQHIDNLKAENQKLKATRKQTNVLNLEIEAAEKSLTEVTNKLANRTLDLEAALDSLKNKDSTIIQLRKEVDLLESAKSSEVKHSQELKQQIDHLHNTLKDEIHNKQQAYEKTKLLQQDVDNLKLELEKVNLELGQITSKHESTLKSIKQEREQLSLQLTTTKAALADCEQKLKHSERATEDLRIEYLDYKIKAQAVLRQNQNRDSCKERELEEELLDMRAAETRLNTTIQTLTFKIDSLEKEKQLLSDDKTGLQKRCKELMTLIEDVRTQNDALNQDIQQHIQQQHETLKQHRQQIESIDNCHKEQIQSLNSSHQRHVEQLRKELSQHIRLPTTVGATKPTILPHHMDIEHFTDQGKINFLLMEREDAEGSEEAAEALATLAASRKISNDSSSAKRSMQDFIPLDELLNTPLNAINTETLIINSEQHQYATDAAVDAVHSSDLLQLELHSTKERLQKQECRVRHLTALLAENEQDLAKLTQLNDMLKEELRRQERSVEREQHMHNSEYIKNVIMKFLTLNNADERTRLVPVLNTILKLTRSETEMLNCVAKGQKVSETPQRSGGWGHLLPWGTNSNNN